MKLMTDLTTFYSNGDEQRFFHGLRENPGVSGCCGIAQQLEITIVQRRLNHDALRDLIALFRRYQIPLSPLSILADKTRFEWLKEQTASWYESMFLKV